jgi:hypothetical protein
VTLGLALEQLVNSAKIDERLIATAFASLAPPASHG